NRCSFAERECGQRLESLRLPDRVRPTRQRPPTPDLDTVAIAPLRQNSDRRERTIDRDARNRFADLVLLRTNSCAARRLVSDSVVTCAPVPPKAACSPWGPPE